MPLGKLLRLFAASVAIGLSVAYTSAASVAAGRPNVLLLVADDLNCDSVGAFGCPVPGVTPAIDRLAAEGLCFDRAHVAVAVCQPSRSAIMTGRHPHLSGGEGFFRIRHADTPTLPEELRRAGYRVGIMGKVAHSTPKENFPWDAIVDARDLGRGRNPGLFASAAGEFMDEAAKSNRPFFLMVNSADPHRPFPGNDPKEWYRDPKAPAGEPRRVFTAEAVAVPGFLPDLPNVRQEVAEYFTAVARLDDMVGDVLTELDRRGLAEETLVIFLSDNGMAFPFAKSNCYLQSTRTPLIVRWPGQTLPGTRDADHFVSGIDLMPTVLQAAGLPVPESVDGRTLLPLLRGETMEGRDRVFTQYFRTHAANDYPMRAVQTASHLYIFNPWSDGEREFKVESNIGRTMTAMREAATNDSTIAGRVTLADHRVPFELYDLKRDPHGLDNRIDDPALATVREELHAALLSWMKQTGDPADAALKSGSEAEKKRLLEQMRRELPATHPEA